MSSHTNKLQISLLMLALLAGCGGGGGGGGSEPAPNPGPSASGNNGNGGTTPPAPTINTPLPPPDTGPGNGIPTGRVTARSAPPGYNPAGAPTQVPPSVAIDANGISGDVLATMLTQQTRTANSTTDLTDAFPFRLAIPWSAAAPGGQPLDSSSAPNVYAFQMMYPVADGGRLVYQTSHFWRHDIPWGGFNFHGLTQQFALKVELPNFRLNANEVQFDLSGAVAANAPLLSISGPLDAAIITETLSGKQPGQKQLSLPGPGTYSIRQGARIPFNQALHTWRQDANTYVDMLLLKGRTPDEVRSCLNIILPPDMKRLACTIWVVPANWALGQRLAFRGNYVADDRSLQAGESGHLFWQTPY
ncbi:MAG: hypothetical protein Q4D19_05790 [Lautropia sp.]|nr:hypothetical protein [Lautropia sp.]